jgi:hypothetical protein
MSEKNMEEITRNKSLGQDVVGVSVDERDLFDIASMLNDVAKRNGGTVTIKVVSVDGEDTHSWSDPNVFLRPEMPREIRSVSIFFEKFRGPVSCRVELTAFPSANARARISVDGFDVETVSGTYREMKKKLENKQCFFSKWLNRLDVMFFLILFFLTGAAISSLLSLVLNLLGWISHSIADSQLSVELIKASPPYVLVGAVIGGFWEVWQLKKAFPIVQFSGSLSDPSSMIRGRICTIFSLILLPLAVNIIASLLEHFWKT